MRNLPSRLFCLVILLLVGLRPAYAQQTAPYDHPLFTGPAHEASTLAFDQEHLRLALRFDFDARRLSGDATLHLRARNETTDSLLLLHAAGLQIDSVWVSAADAPVMPATWRTGGADSLLIRLPPPDSLRDAFEVRIRYEATPRAGLYFVEDGALRQIWTQGEPQDNRHWIPFIDVPGDKLTSELLVTVEPPFSVLSNGQLIDAAGHADGSVTYHWRQDQPHAPYLIMLAIGDYARVHTSVDLPDHPRPVPLDFWVYPGQQNNLERTFGRTDDMMRFFSERLAMVYPWDRYAQVLLRHFQFGGMENTGATTLTDRAFVRERSAIDYDPDGLIAHELAHQWFGNVVTTETWADIWLNEGFATYLSALFKEDYEGADAFAHTMTSLADGYFAEAERYRRPLVWNQWTAPIQMFDAHSYQKGAWVLHMIREQLGDETFYAVLHRYLRTNAFQPVTTDDFKFALEGRADRRFDAFFDQWIYGAGHPEVEVTPAYIDSTRMVELTVRQTQTGFRVPEAFAFDVDVEVHSLTDVARHTLRIQEREQVFHLEADGVPQFVAVDPDQAVLARWDVRQPARAWVAQLNNAEQPVSRLRAARALRGFSEDPALLIALRNAFTNETDATVRAAIVETLGELPPSSSLERALLALTNDESATVRRAVLRALSRFEGSAAVADAAFQAAQNDRSYYVQAEAVRTLARIGAPDARDVVRSALVTPSFREVIRTAAFNALVLLDVPTDEALRYGLDYSASSQPEEVRAAALGYLATFAEDETRAFDRLREALSDPSYRVRRAALDALAGLSSEAAQEALAARLAAEPDARLRLAIEQALQPIPAAETTDE